MQSQNWFVTSNLRRCWDAGTIFFKTVIVILILNFAICEYYGHNKQQSINTINAIMIFMEKGVIPVEDRRLIIPEKVYLGLEDMAANERKKIKVDVIKAMITPKSLAQKLLATTVEKYRQKP